MKDFGLGWLFFAGIVTGIVVAAGFIVRFRLLRCCQIAATKSLEPFKTKDIPFYYSSYAVKQECVRKFFGVCNPLKNILESGDIVPALRKTNSYSFRNRYEMLLQAYLLSLETSGREMSRYHINHYKLPLFAPRFYRALYYYLLAQARLYETDMKSASIYASKALELYQKLGFVYEQGETYLLLFQIYRITGVYDVAETMLREAKKCYSEVGFSAKIAEATAYTGLLELNRENFKAAVKVLDDALAIAKENKLTRTYGDITNWQGLAHYLSGEMQQAEDCFKTAYKIIPSREGQAYAGEMLARVMFKTGKFDEALHYVNKALNIGKNISDKTAEPENLYLKAEILHRLQKNGQSAQILTNLIRKKYPPTATFYPANAYTLLGIIKLERNELELAKTLFKQAADLEFGKNRLKGAVADYNNLAEIAYREGNDAEAETYLRQALAYAENIEDKELAAYLKAKLK